MNNQMELMNAARYLLQCKPRQDARTKEHLTRQGFECFHPSIRAEPIRGGKMIVQSHALYAGYLLFRIPATTNWTTPHSPRGASRVVKSLSQPCKLNEPARRASAASPQVDLPAGAAQPRRPKAYRSRPFHRTGCDRRADGRRRTGSAVIKRTEPAAAGAGVSRSVPGIGMRVANSHLSFTKALHSARERLVREPSSSKQGLHTGPAASWRTHPQGGSMPGQSSFLLHQYDAKPRLTCRTRANARPERLAASAGSGFNKEIVEHA